MGKYGYDAALFGKLVGQNHQDQILECRAAGTVIGGDAVGGLVGDSAETMIWMSSAVCNVIAEQTAGGLVGRATLHGPLIADCYTRGSFTYSISACHIPSGFRCAEP